MRDDDSDDVPPVAVALVRAVKLTSRIDSIADEGRLRCARTRLRTSEGNKTASAASEERAVVFGLLLLLLLKVTG